MPYERTGRELVPDGNSRSSAVGFTVLAVGVTGSLLGRGAVVEEPNLVAAAHGEHDLVERGIENHHNEAENKGAAFHDCRLANPLL